VGWRVGTQLTSFLEKTVPAFALARKLMEAGEGVAGGRTYGHGRAFVVVIRIRARHLHARPYATYL